MRFLVFCTLSLATTLLLLQNSYAEKVYIQVGKANIKKSTLALPPLQFFGNTAVQKNFRRVGHELFTTIHNDLDVSSYFQFIDKNSFLEKTEKVGLKPRSADEKNGFTFENWKPLGTDFLIKAGFRLIGSEIELTAYVYHVPTQKLVFGKQYRNKTEFIRKIAHRFSNDVLEKLTGQRGMFESRIVVSSDRAGGRHKEIFLMDWDAKNVEQITRHKSISISPAISDDGKKIAYTSFAWHKKWKSRNADLFLYDVQTKRTRILSAYKGINSGAAFMPNSTDLLLTISKKGTPDIFRVTETGRQVAQLTRGPRRVMNVEPAISPDGGTVAFSSDRSGKPMIYVMSNKAGASAKRIVFAGWYNSTPTWSPDGKRIAFAGFDKDLKHFDIFLMDKDGHNLIRLTTAKKVNGKYSNNEDPVFSPDGRHVMFISDRTGSKQVYLVNVDGSNERRVTFDRHNYYKPKWSKNLP